MYVRCPGIIVSNRATCSISERCDFGEETEDKKRELGRASRNIHKSSVSGKIDVSSERWRPDEPADHRYVCVAEQSRPGDMRKKSAGHPGVPSVAGRVSTAGPWHRGATTIPSAVISTATTRTATLLCDESGAAATATRHRGRRQASPSTGVVGHRHDTSLHPSRRRLHPRDVHDVVEPHRRHSLVRSGRLHVARLLRRRLHRQ